MDHACKTECNSKCNSEYDNIMRWTEKDIISEVKNSYLSKNNSPLQDAIATNNVAKTRCILKKYTSLIEAKIELYRKYCIDFIIPEIDSSIKYYHLLTENQLSLSESLLMLLKKAECDIIKILVTSDLSIFKIAFEHLGSEDDRLLRYAIKTKREYLVEVICDIYNSHRGSHNNMWIFHIIEHIPQYTISSHGGLNIQTPVVNKNTFANETFIIPNNIFLGVLTESGNITRFTSDFFHPSSCTRIYLPNSRILKLTLNFYLDKTNGDIPIEVKI